MSQVLKQVEKIVVPSPKLQKEKDELVSRVLGLVEKQASSHAEIVGVELGGSFAKGTWLPQRADVDIFIRFKTTVQEKEFAEIGKKIGFAALSSYRPYVRYAEHPFVEAQIGDTKINVVPCYDVEEGRWKSSADRSPFHTRFMRKSLDEKMRNEVRILKWFLKCNGIYGAEIAMQGFSGYVSEVLVLNFGTFDGVIRAVAQLKQGQVIGNAGKKFETPVVIMDPVDPNRNLGAAISTENLGRFVLVSRAFLRKQSMLFFTEKRKKPAQRSSYRNVLVVSFKYKKRSPDIIWGQLKRAATSVATQIDQEGFSVLRKSAVISDDGTASLLFMLQTLTLDENQLRVGPDFFVADHVDKFVAANRKKSSVMWVNDDGKICFLQKRTHTDAKTFLGELLRKNLKSAGISVGLHDDMKRITITRGDMATGKSIKEAIVELVSTDEAIFSSS
ncbi:CCA tRNA nucleotidyltransferase [Candidatus Nitrosotenuis cloacae]|uniref:CCA tRNA nucleotidyltransferase n=1 Tax=Candidatus Nitrosotenuis cloacae TaxID=1603555 RepID=UPI002282A74B|nr:CCA tRNA nucleotidyltransferase [Candidatus Nitrosotenuis cloacae]